MSKVYYQRLFYIVAIGLAIWGLGNVFYWEIWHGYPACIICQWHRALYLLLSSFILITCKYKSPLLRWCIIAVVTMEVAVSSIKIFAAFCQDNICRYISVPDKLNFIFAVVALLSLLVVQIIWSGKKPCGK